MVATPVSGEVVELGKQAIDKVFSDDEKLERKGTEPLCTGRNYSCKNYGRTYFYSIDLFFAVVFRGAMGKCLLAERYAVHY